MASKQTKMRLALNKLDKEIGDIINSCIKGVGHQGSIGTLRFIAREVDNLLAKSDIISADSQYKVSDYINNRFAEKYGGNLINSNSLGHLRRELIHVVTGIAEFRYVQQYSTR